MKTRTSGILAALVLAACPAAAVAGGGVYKVSASLSHAGHEFASPVLVAESGKTAKVAVAGREGYSLAITIEPLADGSLKVSSRLESSHGDLAPVLTLEPGTPGSVAVGDLSMTLTAEPSGG